MECLFCDNLIDPISGYDSVCDGQLPVGPNHQTSPQGIVCKNCIRRMDLPTVYEVCFCCKLPCLSGITHISAGYMFCEKCYGNYEDDNKEYEGEYASCIVCGNSGADNDSFKCSRCLCNELHGE